MRRRLALAPAFLLTAAFAAADPHAGHVMPPPPTQAPDPHAAHVMPPGPDPHAGHVMPAPAAQAPDPHAGHVMPVSPDPHAGHVMAPAAGAATAADLPVGSAAPPPPPAAPLADAVFGKSAMDEARRVLRLEHGGAQWSTFMADRLEVRPDGGGGQYAWEGKVARGGDIDRLVIKTEGEGATSGPLGYAEVQGLYSRAIGPYFDAQAGVRHDFRPGADRTYATVGVEGLAPYWFDVEAALFLSDKGELSGRMEATYDLRLTQRLILQPAAELNWSASRAADLGLGSGLTSAELGARLRYEIRREFAPYVGIHYERSLGRTASLARAAGDTAGDLRVVAGIRAWF